MPQRPAWGKVVDDVARPLSAKSKQVYAYMDAQIMTDEAIRAMRGGDVEGAIQLMERALAYYKSETGIAEGLSVRPKPSPSERSH